MAARPRPEGDQCGHRRDIADFRPKLQSLGVASQVLADLFQFLADLSESFLIVIQRLFLPRRENGALLAIERLQFFDLPLGLCFVSSTECRIVLLMVDAARLPADLREGSVPRRCVAIDVVDEIIPKDDAGELAADVGVVVTEQIELAPGVGKRVAAELDIRHLDPRRAAARVPRRKNDGKSGSGTRPSCRASGCGGRRRVSRVQLEDVLTVHEVPRQAGFFVRTLSSTVMSLGTTPATMMSAPPKRMFSPAASR